MSSAAGGQWRSISSDAAAVSGNTSRPRLEIARCMCIWPVRLRVRTARPRPTLLSPWTTCCACTCFSSWLVSGHREILSRNMALRSMYCGGCLLTQPDLQTQYQVDPWVEDGAATKHLVGSVGQMIELSGDEAHATPRRQVGPCVLGLEDEPACMPYGVDSNHSY